MNNKLTPESVWNSGPGLPTIAPIERTNGGFDIAIVIDGGYSLEDAEVMAAFWATRFARAGLKNKSARIAEVVNVQPKRTDSDMYGITVKCPFCSKTHTHGVQSLDKFAGHRVADCWDPEAQKINSKGYFVYIPDRFMAMGI